ncbi:MAG: putative sulfate exporter family transporter [Rikenellaceae bacterium]
MRKFIDQFKSEDWVIVFVGAIILLLAYLSPDFIPSMPKSFGASGAIESAAILYILLLVIVIGSNLVLRRSASSVVVSLAVILGLAIGGNAMANIPAIKELGLEPVFFSVIFGLLIANTVGTPAWLRAAVQSEFYIKIGIVCLGSTILFGQVVESGVYGLLQSVVVVFSVWYFTFALTRRMGIDREMGTMLSSAVSICGVSAAIATCGAINGNSKKLSTVISLVLVCAIPMMYIMPWLAGLLGLSGEVAGAWLGGTIDTTGAVAAAGSMIGEDAERSAIIVKSSQNVLLGVAAFAISLMWTYKGKKAKERPTLGVIWERFPKFVVGFIAASLIFSFCIEPETAKAVSKVGKSMTTTLFAIAFVCIGLETRFSELFSAENRKPIYAFLIAQGFNILVTLVMAYLMFGVLKPYVAGLI